MLRKNEPWPHTSYRKICSKQNRELNIKYKTIELLEENTRGKFCYLEWSRVLRYGIKITTDRKKLINRIPLILNFCHVKAVNKMKSHRLGKHTLNHRSNT